MTDAGTSAAAALAAASPTESSNAYTVITKQADLINFADRMQHSSFIAWDTEFARGGGTYHPELCLIQCMTDREECVIIDPVAGDLDLTVLRPVFLNENIVFLGHALRQDIEVSLHCFGCAPATLWDTQIAGFFCGESEFRGYAYMVESLLGITLSKQMQYSNWKKRPLSAKQLDYAALDVRYLADIYAIQKTITAERGFEAVVYEESATLNRDVRRQHSGEAAFKKMPIRDGELFTPHDIAMLSSLCSWREHKAMSLDVPRKHVLSDDAVVKIAQQHADPDIFEQYRDDMDAQTIEHIANLPPAEHPFALTPGQYRVKPPADTVTLLQFVLRSCAEQQRLAPEFLASKSELKGLVAFPEKCFNFDQGWRKPIFGDIARAVLHGDMGIYSNNNGGFIVR